jgi:hypothetical protein
MHPWFAGVDWPSLARQKVAFVPQPDCETDTSYFSSKPVSQRSLALDLDSSRSETAESLAAAGLMSPAASLASSRGASRPGSKRASARRRSLRQALAEPSQSKASFSELRGLRAATLSHSSGAGSNTSRASLAGTDSMAVDPSPASFVRAAADLLLRQQSRDPSAAGAVAAARQQQGQQQQQQLGRGQLPARSSTVLSSADLPAGELPAGPLSADFEDEEMLGSGTGSAAVGGAASVAASGGGLQGEADEDEELQDAASECGSSGGSHLGSGEFGSSADMGLGSEGGDEGSSGSEGGSSHALSPHFRNFSFKNLDMLAEQNLEALRWVHVGLVGRAHARQAGRRVGPYFPVGK